MNYDLGFAGRDKEIVHLCELYSAKKCVALVGPSGVGKTALLQRIRLRFPMFLCEETSGLGRICDCLEQQLGWKGYKMSLVERKNRLLRHLARRGEPVVLDHLAFTTPRVARFVAALSEDIPVWIACRSDRAPEIGRVWEHLYKFVRVHVPPLSLRETQLLIENAVVRGLIESGNHAGPLFRLSKGNPRVLEELFIELASRRYDTKKPFAWQLLNIDRRIREVTDNAARSTRAQIG